MDFLLVKIFFADFIQETYFTQHFYGIILTLYNILYTMSFFEIVRMFLPHTLHGF